VNLFVGNGLSFCFGAAGVFLRLFYIILETKKGGRPRFFSSWVRINDHLFLYYFPTYSCIC